MKKTAKTSNIFIHSCQNRQIAVEEERIEFIAELFKTKPSALSLLSAQAKDGSTPIIDQLQVG